ncbi:MAG: hypothetical protein IT359_16920 [Gemmatimonadaceae bacterium]|nr:hypothetical protein [Gemmatimonadaceae bacterium]
MTPRRYRAFGRLVESDHPLAELHEAAADGTPAEWRLVSLPGTPPEVPGATRIGTEDVAYGATVTLDLLGPGAYRLTYTDSGTFDLSAASGEIRWWPGAGCDHDLASMDILGRVMATMLHAEGAVTLHASAVAIDGSAIGFMAPKFTGKSTLAAAMTYEGAQLVSDDALAILPGSPIRVVPGVPSVRLRQESAAHFPRTRDLRAPDLPRWRVVDTMHGDQVASQPLPLAALYVIASKAPEEATVPVRRVALGSIDAIIALSHFAKMGALLGDREGQRHVSRVVDVVASVPVYTLELVRDLQQLQAASHEIAAWHRA